MDTTTRAILEKKSSEYGIPFDFVYAVVMTESGGNTKSIGDNGDSFGLFQINKPAHPSFDVSRYSDPTYQSDYWLPTLAATYKDGVKKGLAGVELAHYVERYGERPVWTEKVKNNITKYYNEITGGTATTTTPSTSTGATASIELPSGLNFSSLTFWAIAIVIFILLVMGFGKSAKELLA